MTPYDIYYFKKLVVFLMAVLFYGYFDRDNTEIGILKK